MKRKFKQIFDPTYLKGGEREQGSKKHGWHKDWKEEKVFMFTWKYCAWCDVMMVICPMCGNNCCNAGFGHVDKNFQPANFNEPNSKKCPVCNLAYQFQHLAWKTKSEPSKPSKRECRRLRKEMDEAMEKCFK